MPLGFQIMSYKKGKYPNYKWAFYFVLIFIIFFVLAMKLYFLEPSDLAYKYLKSFDRVVESFDYETDPVTGGEYRREGAPHHIKGTRTYSLFSFCLIISTVGLLGFCYSLSPTKTLAPFKKSFEKMTPK
tara:strand:+ start:511 stop:897 length:387 start_codon:yes stop_codon:yes gene_type:complete